LQPPSISSHQENSASTDRRKRCLRRGFTLLEAALARELLTGRLALPEDDPAFRKRRGLMDEATARAGQEGGKKRVPTSAEAKTFSFTSVNVPRPSTAA
jgi:hypothetical protein